MTDRERLIELQRKAFREWKNSTIDTFPLEFITDYLLANGVIVPPCKVGDKLYIITSVSQEIVESVVIGAWLADGVFSLLTIHGTVMSDNLGKTIFLTKEEAEQALKESQK